MKIEVIDGGTITSPQGYLAGATYCGLKTATPGQRDLGIILSTSPARAVGLFTQNLVKAAPVVVSQEHLKDGQAQAVVINSGCANAGTGEQGQADAREMATLVAQKLGIDQRQVLVASTGVIGVPLDMDKIRRGIAEIQLSREGGGQELPRAIMTTDTRRKEIAIALEIGGRQVTVAGIAKGAGMVHPNMATMLGFIATDAALEPDFMRRALRQAADISFNMISIDGDTSPNDTLVFLANGQAGNESIRRGTAAAAFQEALNWVCQHLAKTIARDGEGATKLFEITVNGARSAAQARLIVRTVTTSYLVKSAVHGGDPNWGRILAAAGRSGADLEPSKFDLYVEDLPLMLAGRPLNENRAPAEKIMAREEMRFRLELHRGRGSATGWGCDLSEEYVTFNSAYTT